MSAQEQPSRPRFRRSTPAIILGGLGLGLIMGGFLLQWLGIGPFADPQLHGTVLEPPESAPGFALTSHTGKRVSLDDFHDQVALIYFGYTHCPDMCPMTLANLARVRKALGKLGDEVQVLLISLDPERDTPDVLRKYVTAFDPSFLGLTGTPEEIAAAAKSLGIYYQKGEGTVETGYMIDHTASVFAVDKKGALRVIYSLDTPSDDITADMKILARE